MIPIAMSTPVGLYMDDRYGPIPIVEVIWKYQPVAPQPIHPHMLPLPPLGPPPFMPMPPRGPHPRPFPWPPGPLRAQNAPNAPNAQMPNAGMGYIPNPNGQF